MLRFVLLALVALALIYEKAAQTEEIAGSKNFHLSGGASKQMYLLMHRDGMNQENLKKFVQLEDRFLQIERNSVCSSVPHIVEATSLSNLIKDMFPRYNFAYHTIHLKQVAEPTKTVNTRVTC
jgi:hypothetical protein